MELPASPIYARVKEMDFYKLIGSICRQLTDKMRQQNPPAGIGSVREPFCQLVAMQRFGREPQRITLEQYLQKHPDESGCILPNVERAVRIYGVSIDRPSMRLVSAAR